MSTLFPNKHLDVNALSTYKYLVVRVHYKLEISQLTCQEKLCCWSFHCRSQQHNMQLFHRTSDLAAFSCELVSVANLPNVHLRTLIILPCVAADFVCVRVSPYLQQVKTFLSHLLSHVSQALKGIQ